MTHCFLRAMSPTHLKCQAPRWSTFGYSHRLHCCDFLIRSRKYGRPCIDVYSKRNRGVGGKLFIYLPPANHRVWPIMGFGCLSLLRPPWHAGVFPHPSVVECDQSVDIKEYRAVELRPTITQPQTCTCNFSCFPRRVTDTLLYRSTPYPRISTLLDTSYRTRTTCLNSSMLIMVFWSLEKVLRSWDPMNMARKSWLWQSIYG